MAAATLTRRVEILEQKVEIFERLPARMDALELQLLQLREEMRSEFSAIRGEMGGLAGTLRGEMAALANTLREEIRAGDEETRRYMRVLHEEVISRIAMIQETAPRKRPRR